MFAHNRLARITPYRRVAAPLLSALSLTAVAGCWEEIRYDPSRDVAAGNSTKSSDAAVATPPDGSQRSAATAKSPSPAASDRTPVQLAESPPSATPPEATIPAVTADELFDLDADRAAGTSAPPPNIDEGPQLPEPSAAAAHTEDAAAAPSARAVAEPVSAEARLNAWTAASQWSLAAAMQTRQAAAAQVEPVIKNAEAAAIALGVTLPTLPSVGADSTGAAPPLIETAAPLMAAISDHCSPAEGAAAGLAVESHAWLLSYTPLNPPAAEELTEIRAAATASGLPAELIDPLLSLVTERAEFVDVKRAIFTMHREIAAHLKELAINSP
jgi:hypothetical protein